MGNINKGVLRQAIVIGSTSFVIAIGMSIGSGVVVDKFHNLVLALILLFAIIAVGIIFDIIGVATTAAEASPFHAKASKKVKGSRQANNLLANADKVASFCNDVVGDICGTVSGSLGTAIVFLIAAGRPGIDDTIAATIMTGIIAGLTVGGKAAGKKMALEQSEQVVFRVGQVLAWVEDLTGIEILGNKKPRKVREKVTK
ncbi:MAG: hypothetical protein M1543_03650 [Firmicutes bacterium]|nr:hypothetical protein [Bacillota bacterium]